MHNHDLPLSPFLVSLQKLETFELLEGNGGGWRWVDHQDAPAVPAEVDGRVLASLLALRTEALVKNHMLREAKHTLGIFRHFPAQKFFIDSF